MNKQTTMDLDSYLDDVSVMESGLWENEASDILVGWYAVSNNKGIIAYFGDETDAYRFRLDYINRQLNP